MSHIKHQPDIRADFSGILNLLDATETAVAKLGSTLVALANAINELVDLREDFVAHATTASTSTSPNTTLDELF